MSSNAELPERIWIGNGAGIWQVSGSQKLHCPDENTRVEYVRADLVSRDTAPSLPPHKVINFLTALEHQIHRNHSYHPSECAECTLSQAITNGLRSDLKLETGSLSSAPAPSEGGTVAAARCCECFGHTGPVNNPRYDCHCNCHATTPAAPFARCYWCQHPDHGDKVCPVPYLARGKGGVVGSYPCGCARSTIIDSVRCAPSAGPEEPK